MAGVPRVFLALSLVATASAACLRSPAALAAPQQRHHVILRLRGGDDDAEVEHTFAMIKPDVASNEEAVAAIKAQILGAGLTIEREERCRLSQSLCETFYEEHKERPFFGGLVEFMSSGPVIKLELAGPDAIKTWRGLIGPTNSDKAREEAPDSVRALFGADGQRNAAHGSDAPESAARELGLMFA